jgi:hypothetical protein
MSDDKFPTMPLFGQTKEREINGKKSAWLETLEITPFIKKEDGTFWGKIIYTLVDMKDRERIQKLDMREIKFNPEI